MNNQEFINRLKRVIKEKFKGKVRRYALAADVNYGTLMNYLKRGSKPNPDILTKLARAAGMSIAQLYPEEPGVQPGTGEEIVREPVPQYAGPERRYNWPYTHEEQLYIQKLVAILRGRNKKNISAIKENIDAFYETRNVNIPEEVKKTKEAK